MDKEEQVKILRELKYSEEENKSFRVRISEYETVDRLNKNIARDMEQKFVDFRNLQNKLNDKIIELQITGDINKGLYDKIGLLEYSVANLELELNQSRKFKYNLETAENKITNLQLLLQDATMQLKEQAASMRLLQDKISSVILLECLLADAEQELAEWKMLTDIRKNSAIG